MARGDCLEEMRLRRGDVVQGLPRLRRMAERDEVSRMARAQALANRRVLLEAADARAVSAARVDDDQRRQRLVDALAAGQDAQQAVVDRGGEGAAVDDDFVVELQQYRETFALVGEGVVAALAQGVPEQNAALGEIGAEIHPVAQGWRLAQRTGTHRLEPAFLAAANAGQDIFLLQALQPVQMGKQCMKGREMVLLLCKIMVLLHGYPHNVGGSTRHQDSSSANAWRADIRSFA